MFQNQVNFIIPRLAPGSYSLQSRINCGASDEAATNSINITIVEAGPEFFYFTRTPAGNPIAAVNAVTGAFIGAPNLIPGAAFTPAQPNDVVTLFGTGCGRTNPDFAPGEIPDRAGVTALAVEVTIGGRMLPADHVYYAGVTGGIAGMNQLSLRIPIDMPDGDHEVILRLGNNATPRRAIITVRR